MRTKLNRNKIINIKKKNINNYNNNINTNSHENNIIKKIVTKNE